MTVTSHPCFASVHLDSHTSNEHHKNTSSGSSRSLTCQFMKKQSRRSRQSQGSLPLGLLPDAVLLQIAHYLDPYNLLAFASAVRETRQLCCAKAVSLVLALPEDKAAAQDAAKATFAGSPAAWRATGGVKLQIHPHVLGQHGLHGHSCACAAWRTGRHGTDEQHARLLPRATPVDAALAAFVSQCAKHPGSVQPAVAALQLQVRAFMTAWSGEAWRCGAVTDMLSSMHRCLFSTVFDVPGHCACIPPRSSSTHAFVANGRSFEHCWHAAFLLGLAALS